jgi:hypothetical protein
MRNISLLRHRRASAIQPGRPAFSLKEPSPETRQPRRWRPRLAWAAALFSLALKADGTVVTWRRNDFAQCRVPGRGVPAALLLLLGQ